MKSWIIFYVKDQNKSTEFYKAVLIMEPTLFVPGMTEFKLSETTSLGLMPEKGIKSLLGDKLSDPEKSNGISRAELYLHVDDPFAYHTRSIGCGGKELSKMLPRTWGDYVAYSMDLDGNVLAFACHSKKISHC